MRWLPSFFLSTALSLGALPAVSCEVALVLAVDVSGSVDDREFETQMRGLAEALRDGAISEALVLKQASVLVMQWTGNQRQRVSIPWRHVKNFDDTDQLADDIENTPRIWRNFSTAIGEALIFAQAAFDEVPQCKRKLIDVSGDGKSNEGIAPRAIHAQLRAAGITVNGLAIEQSDKTLTEYYQDNLIVGPGSFAIRADNFQDYPDRIRLKLLREITKQLSAVPPLQESGNL
ncbi:DUF1194 domain-containing protein [uncultured Litoreibacter sp.]|uniref:DUF1194 domain-containing protein n=1 Tax=uncultured Litoreibacter sp. TaxID=1392394 RepID=UPI0026163BFB|nr:DUF1194 domain-containing protein [uncultured Litoreibacter sp.]